MDKRRRYIFIAVIIVVSMISAMTASAETGMKITVNEKETGKNAKLIDGKIYVPVDVISDNLNLTVNTDKKANSVTIKSAEENVSEVVSKVSPSVVGIIGKIRPGSLYYNPKGDNLAFGTGVIYRDDGYIVTNAHVVKDLESIVVVLSNSKSYRAKLKAIDESFDLATIKIDKGMLPAASFGDMSGVIVGAPVIAIGTPLSFSLRNSASKGIVSGLNRSTDGEYRFIQTDAAINSGNSGGPLVNMKGEVVGINSSKLVGYGVEGMSFSIPADTVRYVISHFEKYGRVKRPYLGVSFQESVEAIYGLPASNQGIIISEITKSSSAEKAGLKVEDIILSVNGVVVSSAVDYNEEMKKYLPADSVELEILRDETKLKKKVTFGEKKDK